MTKEVLVKIAGLHFDLSENAENQTDDAIAEEIRDEKIEVIVPGQYFLKNGKHYILYEEVEESGLGVIKNTLKVTGTSRVEMKKSGVLNSHMIFEKGTKHVTSYRTPYGQMQIGTDTKELSVREEEERLRIQVKYILEAEEIPVAESRIRIEVVPQGRTFHA